MLEVRGNMRLSTTLIERWNLEISSFHILMGETIITLEDVWCILQILIHGELDIYDLAVEQATLH